MKSLVCVHFILISTLLSLSSSIF